MFTGCLHCFGDSSARTLVKVVHGHSSCLSESAELEKIRGEEAKEREQNLNHIVLLFTIIQLFFLLLGFFGMNAFTAIPVPWNWIVIVPLAGITLFLISLAFKVFLRKK